MVGGGGWWLRPIIVLSLAQAEQYPTLDRIYKMDYFAENQICSFKIVDLVAYKSFGSLAQKISIIGKSQRLGLLKTAKSL